MLHLFGFEKIGVAVSDLYFVDPKPAAGQEGAERGVRLEVRRLADGPIEGSVYASRPILVDRPIWRADLLESVAGGPGTWDRTHHHPKMRGWEPGFREFDEAMTIDPLGFVAEQLEDLKGLMNDARVDPPATIDQDAVDLRAAVPEILETVRRLLGQVRDGHLAQKPDGADPAALVRTGWL